jgi:hypothetical protein
MDSWLEQAPTWIQVLAGLAVTAWTCFDFYFHVWHGWGAVRHTMLRLQLEIEGSLDAPRIRLTNNSEFAVVLTRLCFRAGNTTKVFDLPTGSPLPLTAQPGETIVVPFSVEAPEWFRASRCIMLKLSGGHTASLAIPAWLKQAELPRAA